MSADEIYDKRDSDSAKRNTPVDSASTSCESDESTSQKNNVRVLKYLSRWRKESTSVSRPLKKKKEKGTQTMRGENDKSNVLFYFGKMVHEEMKKLPPSKQLRTMAKVLSIIDKVSNKEDISDVN